MCSLALSVLLLLESFLDKFLSHLKLERNLSSHTILAYRSDLSHYLSFLSENSINDLDEVDRFIISDFLEKRIQKKASSKTLARQIVSIRMWHSFLHKKKWITKNVAKDLKVPQTEKTLPHTLSIEDIDTLLNAPPKTLLGYRDKAMIDLLYATGLRVSEMLHLTFYGVDRTEHFIRCQGKGKRERLVPLGRLALISLENYLIQSRPILAKKSFSNGDFIFLNKNGERLSRIAFWKILKHYLKICHLDTRCSPHTLRHSFATHLIERGADLKSLQSLLGHADLSTTEIYTHMNAKNIQKDYSLFHPRA